MPLPQYFVDLSDVAPEISHDIVYAGTNNFTGRKIEGYDTGRCITLENVAHALKTVNAELNRDGLGLKILDAYRPTKASKDMHSWAKNLSDTKTKAKYYPNISKAQLFKRGYIALKSVHNHGHAVDLTLIDMENDKELDMGTCFDYFDKLSHTASKNVSLEAKANRLLLKDIMNYHGFTNYTKEWWHYSFNQETYPNISFNFDI